MSTEKTVTYTLSTVLIDEIIKYIEETEMRIEYEWGSCRNLEQLIKNNIMPELYNKLLALKNGGESNPNLLNS